MLCRCTLKRCQRERFRTQAVSDVSCDVYYAVICDVYQYVIYGRLTKHDVLVPFSARLSRFLS